MIILLQVPLGVLCKNETKRDDMVDIMLHLHPYVPSVSSSAGSETVYKSSSDTTFHKVFPGGDQLTAARGNATSPQKRLEGLVPMVEDWHAKGCLLGVSYL